MKIMAKSKKAKLKAKPARKPVAKPAKSPRPAKRLEKAARAKEKAAAKRKPTVHPGVGAGRPSRVEILMGEKLDRLIAIERARLALELIDDIAGVPTSADIEKYIACFGAPSPAPAAKPKDVAVEVMEMAQKSAATIGKAHDQVALTNEGAKAPAGVANKLDPAPEAPKPVAEVVAEPIAPTSPAPWMAPAGA